MKPIVHPNWLKQPDSVTDGYSIEVTAKDIPALTDIAPQIWEGAPVAIPYLPGEANSARIAAAKAVRDLGFEPMPHFSARRIASESEFREYLEGVVSLAKVERCFVVAGDPSTPAGPFSDTTSLIETGAFEQAGIKVIGVGGHPEGHPVMSQDECWAVLASKCEMIEARGMAPLIVTQFAFDADILLDWLKQLRARGMEWPVRIGVPGPANLKTLIRYAAMCGVGASTSVLAKYGISIGRLLGPAGPDVMMTKLAAGLGEEHGAVRIHFYPFGGVAKTVDWITKFEERTGHAR